MPLGAKVAVSAFWFRLRSSLTTELVCAKWCSVAIPLGAISGVFNRKLTFKALSFSFIRTSQRLLADTPESQFTSVEESFNMSCRI